MADAFTIVDGINKSHNNDSLRDILAAELKKCKDTILKLINSSNVFVKQDTKKNDADNINVCDKRNTNKNKASINENDNDNEADNNDDDSEADDDNDNEADDNNDNEADYVNDNEADDDNNNKADNDNDNEVG